MDKKPVFGTREWAKYNHNILLGCEHDCRYCYAKSSAVRYKRKTADDWKNPEITSGLAKGFGKRDGIIMYPTSHDITPKFIDEHVKVLKKMLEPGNRVLIVSKPHMECIRRLCVELADYKDQILFRFTMGSADAAILAFWEPNAPNFTERLASLQHAHDAGFKTSVSCEPMLDDSIERVVQCVELFVTDSIWIGKMNKVDTRLKMNGHGDKESKEVADWLLDTQNDERIIEIYNKYKDNPKIKWKESIKKVVGIEIPTEDGLDI